MISIIIPTFNEEDRILALIKFLWEHSAGCIHEIIVVDGGSTDNTVSLVKNQTNAVLLTTEKGRARQMNSGAKIATGKILYFLHADSVPPMDLIYPLW